MNSNGHIRKKRDVSDQGWRNGLEGKSSWRSCRAPGSNSQNPHDSAQDLGLVSGGTKEVDENLGLQT